jgi:hypothetical protein
MEMHLPGRQDWLIHMDDLCADFHHKLSLQESAMLSQHGAVRFLLMDRSQNQADRPLWKLPALALRQHLLLLALHGDSALRQKLAKFVE